VAAGVGAVSSVVLLLAAKDPQIPGAVVRLIAVFVVNDFAFPETTAKFLLCNPTMNGLAGILEAPIAAGVDVSFGWRKEIFKEIENGHW